MRDAFKNAVETYAGHDLMREIKQSPSLDWAKHAYQRLAKMEGHWMRKAIEAGPGWNVWRSHPYTKNGDIFVIVHDFALVAPGSKPPGAGIMFVQPDLSAGERVRLLAGRHDWQDDKWQDECGEDNCGHQCCEDYRR